MVAISAKLSPAMKLAIIYAVLTACVAYAAPIEQESESNLSGK